MKLLTFNEACEYLRVKESWLRTQIFKKTIPYVKLNHLIRFNIDDLNQWLSQNTIK